MDSGLARRALARPEPSARTGLDRALAEARRRFAESLPEQIESLAELVDEHHLVRADPERAQALQSQLRALLHRLRGTAGSLHFDALHALLVELRALLGEPVAVGAGLDPGLVRVLGNLRSLAGVLAEQEQAPAATACAGRALSLLCDDLVYSQQLRQWLEEHGYRVSVHVDVAGLHRAAADAELLILVSGLVEGEAAEIACARAFRARRQPPAPVLILAENESFELRLAALRAGVDALLVRPLAGDVLLRAIERLLSPPDLTRYRLLAIHPDGARLQSLAAVLLAAGFEFRAIGDPAQAYAQLREFQPDVVLIDTCLPQCSATELADLIRQYVEVEPPSLVFCADPDCAAPLRPQGQVGELCIAAGDPGDELIAILRARAQRSRQRSMLAATLAQLDYEREREHLALDAHAIVSVTDGRGDIVYVNDRFCDVSGYARHELLFGNHRILKSGRHEPAFYRDIWRTIATGSIWQGEICNRRKTGELYWVASTIVPFLDERGRPYRYVSVRTDITRARSMEEAALRNEGRLRRSQLYANIGTWDWDIQTGELFCSERVAPLFGRAEGELQVDYAAFLAAVHPEDRQAVQAAATACIEHGEEYAVEHRCLWPDGSEHWLLQRGDVVRDDCGRPLRMLGVVQDVTSRKQIELALQDSRQRLLQAQELASIGSWEADPQSGELHWSDQVYRIFGRDPAGPRPAVSGFLDAAHPDDRELLATAHRQGQGHLDVVHRILRPDGEVRYVRQLARVEHAANGRPGRLLGTVQDITDLKRTEHLMREAKQEAERSRELAERASQAKSEFLASMSHELRTPLNAILGFGQLLQTGSALDTDQSECVQEILAAGRHLLSLINEVLDLARIEAGKLSLSLHSIDLAALLAECVGMVGPVARQHGIELRARCDGPLRAYADAIRCKQVVLNLLSNAIKYNRPGGHVELVAGEVDGYARIEVRDNGRGMDAAQLARLFEPFVRLGAEHSGIEGSGVGLAISLRLVQAMGGRIDVESTPGQGSCFSALLPLCCGHAGECAAPRGAQDTGTRPG